MAEKQWDKAVALRGKSFVRNLETYKLLTRLKPPKEIYDDHSGLSKVSKNFYYCNFSHLQCGGNYLWDLVI